MMTTEKTAAGEMQVVSSGLAPARGGTRLFLGTLPDGRWCVSSRFQYEIRTKSEAAAIRKFKEMTKND